MEPKGTHVLRFTRRRRLRILLMLLTGAGAGGKLRRSTQLGSASLAASQDAAMRTNAALDLGACKI